MAWSEDLGQMPDTAAVDSQLPPTDPGLLMPIKGQLELAEDEQPERVTADRYQPSDPNIVPDTLE